MDRSQLLKYFLLGYWKWLKRGETRSKWMDIVPSTMRKDSQESNSSRCSSLSSEVRYVRLVTLNKRYWEATLVFFYLVLNFAYLFSCLCMYVMVYWLEKWRTFWFSRGAYYAHPSQVTNRNLHRFPNRNRNNAAYYMTACLLYFICVCYCSLKKKKKKKLLLSTAVHALSTAVHHLHALVYE